MLLRRCAACPPSGSPRATAHRSVRFVSILVSAFCPPYDSTRAEQALMRAALSLVGRQSELENGSPRRTRGRPQFSPVRLNDRAADGKPHAQPTRLGAVECV